MSVLNYSPKYKLYKDRYSITACTYFNPDTMMAEDKFEHFVFAKKFNDILVVNVGDFITNSWVSKSHCKRRINALLRLLQEKYPKEYYNMVMISMPYNLGGMSDNELIRTLTKMRNYWEGLRRHARSRWDFYNNRLTDCEAALNRLAVLKEEVSILEEIKSELRAVW